MAKRGRAASHFKTADGEIIVGLRQDKKSGRFYPVGKGSPNFGTNEAKAIHRFRLWHADQGKEPKPDVPVRMPSSLDAFDQLVEGRVCHPLPCRE